MTARLTPAEYGNVLVERAEAWRREHPSRLGAPPLLEWFILDSDVDLVDMDAIDAANAAADDQPTQRRPRRYRPAAHWRAQLERIDARLAALTGYTRHATDDPAAYGGIGIRSTPRQTARHLARLDATSAEVVRLTTRRQDVVGKLLRAERREQETPCETN